MSRRNDQGSRPAWVEAELRRVEKAPAEQRLAALWGIQERLGAEGDVDGKVGWIRALLDAAWLEGRFDYTLKGFGELRRLYGSDSKYADLCASVLWYYKWMVEHLVEHAEVSRETIERVFVEMEAFYRAERESLRPVYSLRCQSEVYMGDKGAAEAWYERWQAAPEGKSDDCAACEADRQIVYFLDREDHEKVMELAEPILKGDVSCNDTPATFAKLIGSFYETGQQPLAFAVQRGTEKWVRRAPTFLPALGTHVVASLLGGNIMRSRRLALVALVRAKASHSDMNRFAAYRSVGLWAVFATMIATVAKDPWPVPKRLLPGAGENATGTVDLVSLATACLDKARKIAGALDGRNGTARYMSRLEELEGNLRKVIEGASRGRRL